MSKFIKFDWTEQIQADRKLRPTFEFPAPLCFDKSQS